MKVLVTVQYEGGATGSVLVESASALLLQGKVLALLREAFARWAEVRSVTLAKEN